MPDRTLAVDFSAVQLINRGALAAALSAEVRGEVRFDPGSRALYATDASNYRQLPLGVVMPRDADDVVTAVGVCRRFGAPILARGGGTSLAGQCCTNGVVLDMSRHFNRVLSIEADQQSALVEPGVVLDDLRATAEEHGLTFGPDPATHSHCTLGGMIGNNSCGVHSILAGRTSDNVLELEVLTYDGLRMWVGPTSDERYAEIIGAGGRPAEIHRALRELRDHYAELVRDRYPEIPRRASGYNLDDLLPEKGFDVARALVGSESTCVVVLAARLRLVPSPPARRTLLLGYLDGPAAADDVPAVMEHHPIGLEGFDRVLVDDVQARELHAHGVDLLPDGDGWLLAEFGADTDEAAKAAALACADALGNKASRVLEAEDAAAVWAVRESGLGAAARVPGAPDFAPAISEPVLLHGHCHEKSVLGSTTETDLLRRCGAEVEAPEDGCCGMAGAFGFEAQLRGVDEVRRPGATARRQARLASHSRGRGWVLVSRADPARQRSHTGPRGRTAGSRAGGNQR